MMGVKKKTPNPRGSPFAKCCELFINKLKNKI